MLSGRNENKMLIKNAYKDEKEGKEKQIYHLENFLFLFFFHFLRLFFLLLIFNGRLFDSLDACSCLDLDEVILPAAMVDFASGNGMTLGEMCIRDRCIYLYV